MTHAPEPRLILASASPRRLEILRSVGLDPEVVPAQVDETPRADEAPLAYAERVAADKAARVALVHPGRPILAADTIVCLEAKRPPIFGKPTDPWNARTMLRELSGKSHRVITASCLLFGPKRRARACETEVVFRALSDGDVEGYLRSGEWQDKAGGYAVQGLGAAFVRAIHGSYTNVVGLPLCEVLEDLAQLAALPSVWALGAPAK